MRPGSKGIGPRRSGLLVAAACLIGALPLEAQEIQGRVLDASSGKGLSNVTVRLLDTAQVDLKAFAVTDDAGKFWIVSGRVGKFRVRVQRIGFNPWVSGLVSVEVGGSTSMDIRMSPNPVELPKMEVLGIGDGFESPEFDRRRRLGYGRSITGPTMKDRALENVVDAVKEIPGITLSRYGPFPLVQFTAAKRTRGRALPPPTQRLADSLNLSLTELEYQYANNCPVVFYLNNARVKPKPPHSPHGLSMLFEVPVAAVKAIEVFPPNSQIPGEFVDGKESVECGVVVVWTAIPR